MDDTYTPQIGDRITSGNKTITVDRITNTFVFYSLWVDGVVIEKRYLETLSFTTYARNTTGATLERKG